MLATLLIVKYIVIVTLVAVRSYRLVIEEQLFISKLDAIRYKHPFSSVGK